MPAIQVLDQHAALLQAVEHRSSIRHTEQQEIRLARVNLYSSDFIQLLVQFCTIPLDLFSLLQQYLVMLQQFPCNQLRQYAHIIRQAQLFQLFQPSRAACKKTEAQPGHAELGKSTHHQQIRIARQVRNKTITGKGIISLIQHDQTGR